MPQFSESCMSVFVNNKMKHSESSLDSLFHKEMFDTNLRATLVRKPQNIFHPTLFYILLANHAATCAKRYT